MYWKNILEKKINLKNDKNKSSKTKKKIVRI